jgi:uncharacterized protein YbjQ (UPF0145 family)
MSELLANHFDWVVFLVLVAIGYFSGHWAEQRHYRSIEEREQRYLKMPLVTFDDDAIDQTAAVQYVRLVSGSAVISIDYFKRFLSSLQSFFGGRVGAYESLVDRARREAILRMIGQARTADIIANVRIETSAISGDPTRNSVVSVEAIAYGTAVRYKSDDSLRTATEPC